MSNQCLVNQQAQFIVNSFRDWQLSQPSRPMLDRILAGSVSTLAGSICHKGMSPMKWTRLSIQTLLLHHLNVDEDAFFILTG